MIHLRYIPYIKHTNLFCPVFKLHYLLPSDSKGSTLNATSFIGYCDVMSPGVTEGDIMRKPIVYFVVLWLNDQFFVAWYGSFNILSPRAEICFPCDAKCYGLIIYRGFEVMIKEFDGCVLLWLKYPKILYSIKVCCNTIVQARTPLTLFRMVNILWIATVTLIPDNNGIIVYMQNGGM